MTVISTKELFNELSNKDEKMIFIDVRSEKEYEGQCVEGIKNIPKETIHLHISELKLYKKVFLMCHGGIRSKAVYDDLKSKGVDSVITVDGGIQSWINNGFPVKKEGPKVIPIMQQVMAIAGTLILTGVLGSIYIHANFIWLAGAVGSGLLLAGVTGNCFMTKLLVKLPWNR
jgi:rhodanese-related sulfurtransferase